jgi:hypothetical protein
MEIRGQAVLKGIKGQASRDLRKSKIPGDQGRKISKKSRVKAFDRRIWKAKVCF